MGKKSEHLGIIIKSIDNDLFEAKLNVQISPTFWGWLFQFGGAMKLAGPSDVVMEYQSMLANAIETCVI